MLNNRHRIQSLNPPSLSQLSHLVQSLSHLNKLVQSLKHHSQRVQEKSQSNPLVAIIISKPLKQLTRAKIHPLKMELMASVLILSKIWDFKVPSRGKYKQISLFRLKKTQNARPTWKHSHSRIKNWKKPTQAGKKIQNTCTKKSQHSSQTSNLKRIIIKKTTKSTKVKSSNLKGTLKNWRSLNPAKTSLWPCQSPYRTPKSLKLAVWLQAITLI